MLNSRTNRIALYISAVIIIMLILFALLRDNADSVTLREATTMLQEKSVEKVIVSKEYVYLKTKHGVFKIASSQVSPKMFIDQKVEVGGDSNALIYILFSLLFLGFFSFVMR